jgi:leucyl aminopeptidase
MISYSNIMALPNFFPTEIHRRRAFPDRRQTDTLDALVVIAGPETRLLARLPHASGWRQLHRRARPQALTVRVATLPAARQPTAVLGYAKADASAFEQLALAGKLLRALSDRRPRHLQLVVDDSLSDAAAWYEALLTAALTERFALPAYRSHPKPPWPLQRIDFGPAPPLDLPRIVAAAEASNLARSLTAQPPNKLDARAYRRLLGTLAKRHRLQLRWFSETALRRLGAGAFLAVSRGNAARDAGIARLSYRGARRRRTLDAALVGKGILFDTGGINLKPHRYMLDMHTDMGGSAVALATLVALAQLRAPLNVDAWLAISENNIGPDAYRPQDVVRALNGTTIQVIHSDAEGRMVLADTLALAARSRPRALIDFATLTGACVHALTERYSGVFSNRPQLADTLVDAGRTSGERVWAFPMDEDFDGDLDSSVADIVQCPVDGKGDHILAARFLKRFVPDHIPWVHVDLSSATRRGGLAHVGTEVTGFGVRWALELLLSPRLAAVQAAT